MKLAYHHLRVKKLLYDNAKSQEEKIRIALSFMEHDAAILLEEMKPKLEDESNDRKSSDTSSGAPQ